LSLNHLEASKIVGSSLGCCPLTIPIKLGHQHMLSSPDLSHEWILVLYSAVKIDNQSIVDAYRIGASFPIIKFSGF
jgi:hypothetical protein